LVIAGGRGWKSDSIESELRTQNSELRDKIKLVGAVDKEELIKLYQNAALFAFPTLYEGFGLPVLEAMASGVPVLSSNVSSIPEFAENAAILVNPYKVEEIGEGMVRILQNSDLADKLREKGKKVARKYTWEKNALHTLKVYEELITNNK